MFFGTPWSDSTEGAKILSLETPGRKDEVSAKPVDWVMRKKSERLTSPL